MSVPRRQLSAEADSSPADRDLPGTAAASSPPVRTLSAMARPVAAVAVAAAVLFFCYLRLSQTAAVTADGASNVLQAWDMLHGNLLLHGWWLSDVSFYTTELPQYMLVELVRGLGPDVVHIAAAMTYTLLVVLAGLLAKGRASGRAGLIRFLIAAGIMLAPQLGNAATILILVPDHVGTGVPLLICWLIIDRAQPRWWVPVATGVLLAWVQVADSLALLTGAVPLVIACAARVGYRLVRRRADGQSITGGLVSCWYELSLAVAAIGSVAAAALASRLIRAAGGYVVWPPSTPLSPIGLLRRHAELAYHGVLTLFGADFAGQRPGIGLLFAAAHLVGVAMAATAFCLALRQFLGSGDLLVPAFAAAIALNLAAYVGSQIPVNIATTREIAIVLPYGAVLAGRLLAGPLIAVRRPARIAVVAAAACTLLCYLAAIGYDAAQRPVPAEDSDLVAWLARHHLSHGLGSYWQANSTTADSGGLIEVRAAAVRGGLLQRNVLWEAKLSWYDPGSQYANFVVVARQPSTEYVQISAGAAVRAFGQPARTYRFGRYIVMVWNKNLLATLAPWSGPVP
jgi:hypothetical protein